MRGSVATPKMQQAASEVRAPEEAVDHGTGPNSKTKHMNMLRQLKSYSGNFQQERNLNPKTPTSRNSHFQSSGSFKAAFLDSTAAEFLERRRISQNRTALKPVQAPEQPGVELPAPAKEIRIDYSNFTPSGSIKPQSFKTKIKTRNIQDKRRQIIVRLEKTIKQEQRRRASL